jgi:hypothetical protein
MSSGEYDISWEEVGEFMMPTLKGDAPYKIQVEPNWVSFSYTDGADLDSTFLSMTMDEWIKLGAAISILQSTMLSNARKVFDEHKEGCNGDCHCG